GCVQRLIYPQVNAETARLLSRAGWDVVIPPGQGCCGALHLHGGRLDEFRALARALAQAFPEALDHLVVNAAGCGSAIREYGHWLGEAAPAAALARKTRDVTELLVEADLPLRPVEAVATYHDACHLVHGQGMRSAPRALLARIPGTPAVRLPETVLRARGRHDTFAQPTRAAAPAPRRHGHGSTSTASARGRARRTTPTPIRTRSTTSSRAAGASAWTAARSGPSRARRSWRTRGRSTGS